MHGYRIREPVYTTPPLLPQVSSLALAPVVNQQNGMHAGHSQSRGSSHG